jgi:hypothetical protein
VNGFTVSGGPDGNDTLSGIERLQFADNNVALDLDGNAGMVAKLLGVTFGPATVTNENAVGIGLYFADDVMNYSNLAQLAIDATGAATPQQVVNLLWTNVVGSAPTLEQSQPFVDMLNRGMTSGALTILAADLDMNLNNINLLGLAQTGLDYIAV